jgi:hypothetical protein
MEGTGALPAHLGVLPTSWKTPPVVRTWAILAGWLRSEITRIEQQLAKLTDPLLEARVEFSKLAEA